MTWSCRNGAGVINPLYIRAAALAGVLLPVPAFAQNDFQQWVSLSAELMLAERITVQDEIVARFSDDRSGLYEVENALMLGYALTEKVTAWAGYVHNPQYAAGLFTVMERRARQQVTVDDIAMIGTANLSGRLRMEQRWREGAEGTAWRARPYMKLAISVGDDAPTINLTAEPFINLNSTAFQSDPGFERLRSALSISVPAGGPLELEVGYLHQRRFIANAPDTNDHALTVSVDLSF